jgi:hypothetical protein
MQRSPVDRRLQLQLEYLRSDERLRELAGVAAELTSEERLEQAWAMSRSAAAILAQQPDDLLARIEAVRDALGPGAENVLPRLARLASPGSPRGAATE